MRVWYHASISAEHSSESNKSSSLLATVDRAAPEMATSLALLLSTKNKTGFPCNLCFHRRMAQISATSSASKIIVSFDPPLSAHLQAGKGRSLTLEHAHRTAAAMAQICLKQGNQGARSPKEAKEYQDRKTANTHYRASPPVNQGLSSHSLSQVLTFPQLGLPSRARRGG